MLQAKKRADRVQRAHPYRKHLDSLYARRSAIDALIESLKAYEMSRPKHSFNGCRKSA